MLRLTTLLAFLALSTGGCATVQETGRIGIWRVESECRALPPLQQPKGYQLDVLPLDCPRGWPLDANTAARIHRIEQRSVLANVQDASGGQPVHVHVR